MLEKLRVPTVTTVLTRGGGGGGVVVRDGLKEIFTFYLL